MPFAVVHLDNLDLDLIANMIGFAVVLLGNQLGNGDQPIRLVADVDAHLVVRHLHDGAGNRLSGADGDEGLLELGSEFLNPADSPVPQRGRRSGG